MSLLVDGPVFPALEGRNLRFTATRRGTARGRRQPGLLDPVSKVFAKLGLKAAWRIPAALVDPQLFSQAVDRLRFDGPRPGAVEGGGEAPRVLR